jgi:hypothetical protein
MEWLRIMDETGKAVYGNRGGRRRAPDLMQINTDRGDRARNLPLRTARPAPPQLPAGFGTSAGTPARSFANLGQREA